MSQKTLLQDSNSEWDTELMLDAYREAAASDDYMFGDCDYSYVWNDTESNDVY